MPQFTETASVKDTLLEEVSYTRQSSSGHDLGWNKLITDVSPLGRYETLNNCGVLDEVKLYLKDKGSVSINESWEGTHQGEASIRTPLSLLSAEEKRQQHEGLAIGQRLQLKYAIYPSDLIVHTPCKSV